MGFLDWRLWDRLDDLDRRVGIRPIDTQQSTGFVKIFGAVLLALTLVNLVEGDWTGMIINGGLAIVVGAWHLKTIRRRISDEGESSP